MASDGNSSEGPKSPPTEHGNEDPRGKYLYTLALGALGVVYGDIGTSPLYAMRECFNEPHGVAVSTQNVLGVLSLIFWSLVILISTKYLGFVMRADNRGEGGILVLMSLIMQRKDLGAALRFIVVTLSIFGAALLYGDGVITPAISVLSAVEGLNVATPVFEPYILPITIIVIVGLFVVQRRGTAKVGAIFGPFTLVWFTTLGLLGITGIIRAPMVLGALVPTHAVEFLVENKVHGFLVLSSVFLVVTGGEALYADMGHFGRKPIRLAWFAVAMPGLLLNYFGQGALLLSDPTAASHPFYLLAPEWSRIPLVVLATGATVIASQAVISGAFSLTRSAIQLGYWPRMEIVHTSAEESGQIYVPTVNWALLGTVIVLVLGFRSSSALVGAYGIAVSTTMVITTVMMSLVMRRRWGWSMGVSVGLTLLFFIPDISFLSANFTKLAVGGWFPLLLGAVIFTLMTTWKRGREILSERLRSQALPMDLFIQDISINPPVRVPGTAVFMTSTSEGVPTAMLHNIKHNKVLHDRVVLLTIRSEDVPSVPGKDRLEVQEMGHGFWRLIARYGFMEHPHVREIMNRARDSGLDFKISETTFFLGRETLIPSKRAGMAMWREALFSWMSRNARSATAFFGIPPNRVVELGAQIEL